MPKVELKDGESLEQALKRFKRVSSSVKQEVRKREYHLRPGLKRKEKAKLARETKRKFKY